MQRLPILTYPKLEEARYKRFLLSYVEEIESITSNFLFPKIKERQDASIEDVTEVFDSLRSKFSALTIITTKQAKKLLSAISAVLERRVQNNIINNSNLRIKAFNDANSTIAQGFDSTLATNIALIKSIEEKYFLDLQVLVDQAFKEGWSVARLTREIKSRYNVTENRAALIARDQIGKLASFTAQIEQTAVDINQYVFHTSHDDRVRTSHEVMDGKICQWDNPTTYRDTIDGPLKKRSSIGGVLKHYGIDFQCRCTGQAILPDYFKEYEKSNN